MHSGNHRADIMIGSDMAKFISAIMLMAVSLSATAIECNQQSPNYIKEGDAYFDIPQADPLSSQQQAEISRLFSAFQGRRLKGNGTVTECFGPEKSPRMVVTQEDISAEIQKLSGGKLVIGFEVSNRKKKVSHNETLKLFGDKNQYQLIELTNNELKLRSRLRIRKHMDEELVDISIKNNSLVIDVTRFVNGYFAVHNIRTLYR